MKAIAAAVIATLLLGAGAAQAQSAPEASAVVSHSVRVGAANREYLLYRPANATGPVPLVIALHGGGGNARTMVPRWIETARREGFAVAFPNGVGRMGNMGTWNAGGCCGFAMTSNSDDLAFIGAVIDDLTAQGIDPKRVYVTGLSNGGMLSHRIGIGLSSRIAAVAVVSGAMFGGEAQPSRPLPILIMHGEKDDIVPFNGGNSPMSLVARSQSQSFLPVSRAVDFWRRADGCAGAPSVEVQGDVTVETSACRDGSEVVFYRLASAGHTWPGPVVASGGLERARYDAIDATQVIWRFFSGHSR